MAAYEDVRMIAVEQFTGTWIVASGISSDMGQKDLHSFAVEETVKRMDITQIVVVTVAGHTHQRLECSNLLRQFHPTAEITGMPYLIHRGKKVTDAVIEDAVSIGYKTYIHEY